MGRSRAFARPREAVWPRATLSAQVTKEASRADAADKSEHYPIYHRLAHEATPGLEATLGSHQLPGGAYIYTSEAALLEDFDENILLGALSHVPKAGGCIAHQVAIAILSQRCAIFRAWDWRQRWWRPGAESTAKVARASQYAGRAVVRGA